MKECTKCGYEMSDSIMFCPTFGAKQDNHTRNNTNYSDDNFKLLAKCVNANNQVNRNAKKSDSPLSITACVLSGVAFILPLPFLVAILLFFLAFLFALIDLGINNKTQRHVGSGVALVFCVLVTILICFM